VIDSNYLIHQEAHILTAQKVLKVLKKHIPHGKLLDVGCATGDFLSVAQECYGVEGLEPSKWSSDLAKKRGFTIHTCTLSELPADAKFDVITLWGVIEHFESLKTEVSAMYRILNPGGYVCIWTGDINSWLSRLLGKNWWYIQGQHVQVFSRESLDKLFTDNNFKPVTVEIYPFTTTLSSLSKSFYRYGWLKNIVKLLLENRFVRDKVVTLKLPGEMLAIYQKNEVI
jgi:2-polyprenyl-3-methyl-5-hydroxy-6-metoxy-1,4-benzoquinol methylase